MARPKGCRLFRDIVATNGLSVRKGHSLLTTLVAAGEVPLALTAYGFLAEQAKRKGAPLDWFVIPPAIARSTAEGLARNAPHPYAAVLFYDFLIGDGQQILASRAFVPASRNIETPFKGPLKLIDFGLDARPGQEVAGALSEDDRCADAVTDHRASAFRCSGPGRNISFCTRQFRISAT